MNQSESNYFQQPESWFVHDDNKSFDLYKELKNVYTNNNFPLNTFFGAGFSSYCGIPIWEDILKELCKPLRLSYQYLKGNNYDKASEISGYYDGKEYPDRLIDEIRNLLKPIHIPYTPAHLDILNGLFGMHMTTNWDKILSTLIKDYQFSIPEIAYPDLTNDDTDIMKIVYIHGHAFQSEKIIFTKEQYEIAYNDEMFKTYLSEFFIYSSTLFFGFSFEDKYFEKLYKIIFAQKRRHYEKLGKDKPLDFILVPFDYSELDDKPINYDKELRYQRDFYNSFGLEAIFFNKIDKNGFINLGNIINGIIKQIPPSVKDAQVTGS